MIVRNVLAVIGGATVVAAVAAAAALIAVKRLADTIPDELLDDAEPVDLGDIDADLGPGPRREPRVDPPE